MSTSGKKFAVFIFILGSVILVPFVITGVSVNAATDQNRSRVDQGSNNEYEPDGEPTKVPSPTPTDVSIPPTPSDTPTPTPTDTSTPTLTPTPSDTPTPTPTDTSTPTPTASSTPPSSTPTPTLPPESGDVFLPVILNAYCSPDSYEPNNGFGSASVLSEGSQINAYFCPGDPDDVYRISITQTIAIEIELIDVPAQTDLDLYLYDDSFTIVAASNLTGGGVNELITYTPTKTGDYYVRVYPFSKGDDAGMSYKLSWKISPEMR